MREDVGDEDRSLVVVGWPVSYASNRNEAHAGRRAIPAECDFRELMLVRVADNNAYAGQSGDFFRGALGIASGDHDACIGILPVHPANCGAGILICRSRHGAGVQNDDRGVRGTRSANQSLLYELAF